MQLLKISYMPIQYQYQIEPARLESQKPNLPEGTINRTESNLQLKSKNIKVNLDTTKARESLNMRTPDQWAREYGNRGKEKATQATGEYVQMGNQMQQIQNGVNIGDIIQQKIMNAEQPTTFTTFLPATGADISWEAPEIQTEYDAGEVRVDWDVMRNIMNFVPGKFSIEITQYPEVKFEYLGGFHYVPPSADPDYEAPSGA